MVLVIRSMEPETFGVIAAAMGVFVAAQTLSDLGLSAFVVRERAAAPSGPRVRTALHLIDISSAILAVLTTVGSAALAKTVGPVWATLALLGIASAAEKSAEGWLGVALADGKMHLGATSLMARRTFVFGATAMAVWKIPSATAVAFAGASAIAGLGSLWFAHVYVGRRVAPGSVRAGEIVRASRAYWANSVATQLRNLDAVLMQLVAPTLQAGYYGAMSRLTGPLRILPTSLALVLIPRVARADGVRGRALLRLVLVSAAAFAVLFLAAAAIVPWLVTPFLGAGYAPVAPALQVLVAGISLAGLASLAGAALQGLGRARLVANVATLTTLCTLGGILLGGASAGALGAVIALVTGFALQGGVLTVALARTPDMVRSDGVLPPVERKN